MARKKSGAGEPAATPQADAPPAERADAGATKKRDRMAFDPGDALADRIRNYIYWTPGASLNEFLLRAATKEMELVERQENGGKPWPPRRGRLKTGRPIS